MRPFATIMITFCAASFGSGSAFTQIDAPVPELRITPDAREYRAGQPILIRFTVRNPHKVDIPSAFRDNADLASSHFELAFTQESRLVAKKV